jgi:hypothetical protein
MASRALEEEVGPVRDMIDVMTEYRAESYLVKRGSELVKWPSFTANMCSGRAAGHVPHYTSDH